MALLPVVLLIIRPERYGAELELLGLCRLQAISPSFVVKTPDDYDIFDMFVNTHEPTTWRRHVLTSLSSLTYVRRPDGDCVYVESESDALSEAIEQEQTGDVLGDWQKHVGLEVHLPDRIMIKDERTIVIVAVFKRLEWVTEREKLLVRAFGEIQVSDMFRMAVETPTQATT